MSSGGMHNKEINCDVEAAVDNVENLLEQVSHLLFPQTMMGEPESYEKYFIQQLNGGWADVRDHVLCINMANISSIASPSEIHEALLRASKANQTII